ncbi:MAG TPA: aminotransferase class I/II-fold pyridoxal phosphate-dependent enzyme [Micromonosporaceae bacterium]
MTAHYQIRGSGSAAIVASVETGVRSGALPAGTILPAVRALAAELGVAPGTVATAYQVLRQRGVVETAGRRGTRVRSRPSVASPRSARRLPVPPGAVDLAAGGPDERLLPPLAAHLARLRPASVDYDQGGPLPELVAAARDRLAADRVPTAHAAITVTAGALDGIERVLATHVRPGDPVAVEDPGWANLLDLVAALDLRPVPVPVDDDGPRPESLARALTAGARAVVVTARAHNPTGASVGAGRAAELREILAGYPDVLLVEDDHAAELATVPAHPLAGATSRWAFVRSVAKPYGPDLRLALCAGDEATISRVEGRMRLGTGWVSTILQRLVLELWSDAAVTAAVDRARDSYARRREGLLAALAARGVTAHGRTGLNVWVPVPDETATVAALRDAGYVVAAGSAYRIGSPPAVRVTISRLDPSDLEPLADAIAAAVRPTGRRSV